MKTDNSWFEEWYWYQATPDEKRLMEKVYDFEALFEDMLFKKGTSTCDLLRVKVKANSGEWTDVDMSLPDDLEYFSIDCIHFKVETLQDEGGYFDHEEQTVCIAPEQLEKDDVILHELIHVHECAINDLPMYFHDMVYWALYKDLKKKIPELDDIITGHAHLLTGSTIYSSGGLHDILFMLKSFDLDIRMGYPLGTVFAYGRDEELKGYTYIKG